jgi:FkbM family methyltransferase
MEKTFDELLSQIINTQKFNILDLGSYNGFDAVWNRLGKNVKIIGIDPLISKGENTTNGRVEINLDSIISDKEEKIEFNICKNRQASSCLKTNYPLISRFHQIEQGEVESIVTYNANKLSDLLIQYNINDLDFIKIDIEGSELKALNSIEKLLNNNVLGIQIETFFQPYHIDRPLFSDIVNYLTPFGFKFFDFRDMERWGKKTISQPYGYGQVMFANSLFLKDPILDNNIEDIDKIQKLIVLSTLFEQIDFAGELIQKYLI